MTNLKSEKPGKIDYFSTLEREAFIASGLTCENLIANYIAKLDHLYEKVAREFMAPGGPVEKARGLFEGLWAKKPHRYRSHGPFKIYQVIDAQMNDSAQIVGNCLGLTLLYNCLIKRPGIKANAIYIENAFDIGPHVLTLISIDDNTIDIENILPNGFDYKGHLDNPSRIKWGDKELVADIYLSLGNECSEKGEFPEALRNYEKAIALNPEYEKAHLNKAIVMGKMAEVK